jgi:hypothetical protein
VRRARWCFDSQGDLVGDADAVAFEGDDFFRVIGEDANVAEPEIDQDLGADAAFVLDHALAGGFAIELAAFVKMNLRERAGFFGGFDAEATSGVMQVEENAALFLGDGGQRPRDELAAIASSGTEDISGEAVRMDAHQCGFGTFQIAEREQRADHGPCRWHKRSCGNRRSASAKQLQLRAERSARAACGSELSRPP